MAGSFGLTSFLAACCFDLSLAFGSAVCAVSSLLLLMNAYTPPPIQNNASTTTMMLTNSIFFDLLPGAAAAGGAAPSSAASSLDSAITQILESECQRLFDKEQGTCHAHRYVRKY